MALNNFLLPFESMLENKYKNPNKLLSGRDVHIYLLSYWFNHEEMHLIFQEVAVAKLKFQQIHTNRNMVNISKHKKIYITSLLST